MDDNLIKNDYKYAMESIVSDNAEKDRAKALFDNEVSYVTRITGRSRKIPKFSAAVIAFACVLALGGGAVWAMTASPLKDYLFKNSTKEFEQVYTEVGKEFIIGNHKVVFEGSSYEDAVGTGYLNLSFWDLLGNPVQVHYPAQQVSDTEEILCENMDLRRHIMTNHINIDGDDAHILMMYLNAYNSILDDNNMFIKFQRYEQAFDSEYYADKPFKFLILNNEQWNSLKNDIEKLNSDKLISYTYEKNEETGVITRKNNFDYDYIQPEVCAILEKYWPYAVKSITSDPQIIEIDNLKLIIGRTDMVLYYNKKNCSVKKLIFRRDNGSEIKIVFEKGFWRVKQDDDFVNLQGAAGYEDGAYKAILNYGFILGEDEKVTIEINGQDYR